MEAIKFAKKRAAAYCRVSTDMECQEMSFETQKQYYTEMLLDNPDEELVGIYADEGSGRSIQGRPGFQQMIKDCEDGKIDVIYTKSISRFSRNMLDCVTTVRKLKSLGVPVIFEKEGLSTLDGKSELFFHILAIIAEEESKSIGQNIKAGIDSRHERGIPTGRVTYGYRRVNREGEWRIEENEARRVRYAFEQAANGVCYEDIRAGLDRMEKEEGTGVSWSKNRNRLTALLRHVAYIQTDDPTCDFALSMMAAVAQDESHSISRNIQAAYESRYARGEYNLGNNRILGYDCRKGKLVPNKDAWIVGEIFKRFLAGQNYTEIVDDLEKMGAKSKRGKKRFSVETLRNMLTNETYVGDKRLQKQPPKDYLTKKPDPSREYKTYYLKDDHEPLIDRETWDKVQEILNKCEEEAKNGIYRTNGEHHELYGKIFCGECGAPFVRRTFRDKKGNHYKAWNCRERQKGSGCVCHAVREEKLMEMVAGKDYERITVYEDRVEVE